MRVVSTGFMIENATLIGLQLQYVPWANDQNCILFFFRVSESGFFQSHFEWAWHNSSVLDEILNSSNSNAAATMYLRDVLSSLSNTTKEVNDFIYLDPKQKLVVYQEPGIMANSTVGVLFVPSGFNIFTLLNISSAAPEDTEGWSIVLKNESIRYEKLESIFQVKS